MRTHIFSRVIYILLSSRKQLNNYHCYSWLCDCFMFNFSLTCLYCIPYISFYPCVFTSETEAWLINTCQGYLIFPVSLRVQQVHGFVISYFHWSLAVTQRSSFINEPEQYIQSIVSRNINCEINVTLKNSWKLLNPGKSK